MNKEKRKFNKVIKDRKRHKRYLITKRQNPPRKRKKITHTPVLSWKLSWWQRLKNWLKELLKR